MAFLPFLTEQFPGGSGLPGLGGAVTNFDNPSDHPEDNLSLPWCVDPAVTWLFYDCGLEILLDPGSVLHKPLPQRDYKWDSLGSVDITDQAFMSATDGINLESNSKAQDIIQRMATSTYRFALVGSAWRAGYQVTVPNLKSVDGQEAVPTFPHRVSPKLQGNLMGGIPLWSCAWELHYLVRVSPRLQKGTKVAVPNPAAAIRPTAELPSRVLLPTTPVDSRATQDQRIAVGNFVRGSS